MSGSFGVRVSGLLESFAEGFASELAGLGYSSRGGEAQLRLLAHLSRWMTTEDLALDGLSVEAVARFVAARRASHRGLRSPRALVALLGYLRSIGVVGWGSVLATTDPVEVLLERFGAYLSRERGLTAATVRSYVSQVRPFVREHAAGGWDALSGRQVAVFVTERSLLQPPRSVAVRANALRALLRWLWRERLLSSPSLVDAVGKIAAPTGTVPARALSADDLDSERCLLRVSGKNRRLRQLPLDPTTVAALLDYLKLRARFAPPTGPLLIGVKGGRLNLASARTAFRALADDCRLPITPGCRAPRLHDTRHTFAVNTLIDAHREGADVDARIATLTNYLGHVDPAYSYWYLTASPQLMQIVRDRISAWQELQR